MSRAPGAPLVTRPQCVVCARELYARWTDTHGVAACTQCGAPYRILHYEGEGTDARRVDRPPSCLLLETWVPLLRQYWSETRGNVSPGAFNMPGSSYEVASEDDFMRHREWMEAHRPEWPVPEPSEPR